MNASRRAALPITPAIWILVGATAAGAGAVTGLITSVTGRSVFAISGFAGAALLVLLVAQPRHVLPLLFVALPFARGKWFDQLYINAISPLIILGAVGFFLRRPLLRHRGALLATLFFGWLLAGAAYTRSPVHAASQGIEILAYLAFFLLITAVIREPSDICRFRDALLVSGLLAAALALPEVWLGNEFLFGSIVPLYSALGLENETYRVAGPWLHPNWLGEHMAIVLILAATMEGNWRRWALAGGVLVLCGAGLYFSYSRTAWLGLIAVFGLYTATNRPTQSLRAIAVCGLALGFGVLLATLLNVSIVEIMQRRMAELSESQFSMRLLVWPTAWAMFRTHPLFGVGLGSFATAFADDFPPIHWAWSPDHAHNVFLQIACQHGVIGLALFMILAGRAFFAYRAARNLRDPAARSAAKGLLYAFIALLAMGLSDHQYFDVRLGLLFFGVPAILYAAGGIGKQSEYALSPHR